MSEAGLSYLGLGVAPPKPSLGLMLSDAQQTLLMAPWNIAMPAIVITLLVMSFNSVSYTHLDVYKRQAGNRKADICLNFKQRFAAVAGTDLLLSAHCCGVQFRRRSDLFTGRSENSSEVK